MNVIHTGVVGLEVSPVGESLAMMNTDELSMSLNSLSTTNDSLLQDLQDEDDNIVTRDIHDKRLLQLQVEDDDYLGDGCTFYVDSMGFEDLEGFVMRCWMQIMIG